MKKHEQSRKLFGNKKKRRTLESAERKTKVVKEKKFHAYVALLMVWLIGFTVVITRYYSRFNDFLVKYETAYELSRPDLAMEDIFAHFEAKDVNYIWDNMTEKPVPSEFENEDTIKTYMSELLADKEITYRYTSDHTEDSPSYVIEADGYTVGGFTLDKDPNITADYGFPVWILGTLEFYTEPFESVKVSAPSNFEVYINDVLLDESYITDSKENTDDSKYVADYGQIPPIVTYEVTGLYEEPEVSMKDFSGFTIEPVYDEATDIYSSGYSNLHPDKSELSQFAIEFTTTFANVISQDASLSDLNIYFPENSEDLGYISRNTALEYFTAHGSVTIENEEILEFTAFNDDLVYIECYIEQWMQMGWGGSDPEVVDTTTHLYIANIDGEWKIIKMRY